MINLDETAASLVLSLQSPAFTTTYPILKHAERIPPDRLAAMELAWKQRAFGGRRIHFHRLRHVFVAEEGLVFDINQQLYSASQTQHSEEEVASGLASVRQAIASGSCPAYRGVSVLIKKRGAVNYGHWLIEMLPKAFLAVQYLRLEDAKYVVHVAPDALAAAIQRSLALVGVPSERVLATYGGAVFFEELVLIDGMTSHGNYMSPRVFECLDHVQSQITGDPPAPLYVSRATSLARCLENEPELIEVLTRRGCRVIDPALLSFDQQVAAFKAAPTVLGVMGAGLTNIAFAPYGAAIVDMAPAVMPDTFFWFIANIRRQRYMEIRCEQRGPVRGNTDWDTDLYLPAAELHGVLDTLGVGAASQGAAVARRPRVVAIAMVRNEQDLIEPFVRHNLGFVDAMVVVDNGSVDATADILLRLARELPGLIVAHDDAFGFAQSARLTQLMQGVQAGFHADYIIPLDADEFLRIEDHAAFADVLAAIPSGGFGLIPWQTLVLVEGEVGAAAVDPPRTLRWRRTQERPPFHKAILRLDGASGDDLVIHQGAHGVGGLGRSVEQVKLTGAVLQHVPVRSREQILSKVLAGWVAYVGNDPNARAGTLGTHWRDLFDRFSRNPALDDGELCQISQRFGQGGVGQGAVPATPPDGYERRYSTGGVLNPTALLARSWERSLAATRRLLDLQRPDLDAVPPIPGLLPRMPLASYWDELCVDIPPFRALHERHEPASMLEIGCGVGAYPALFKRLGVAEVFGIDALPPQATVLAPFEYAARDPGAPLDLCRQYAVVLCLELIGVLPESRQAPLIEILVRHASEMIVFAGAYPGHPLGRWLAEFRARGWVPDLIETLGLRSLASLPALRRKLVVLRRGADHADAIRELEEIDGQLHDWPTPSPGIRDRPFAPAH